MLIKQLLKHGVPAKSRGNNHSKTDARHQPVLKHSSREDYFFFAGL